MERMSFGKNEVPDYRLEISLFFVIECAVYHIFCYRLAVCIMKECNL